MREILRQYAAGYAKSEEQLTLMEDDQSSIQIGRASCRERVL